MGYKLISVKCPDCGKTLSIEEDRTQAYCSYCGAKVLISNENEYIFRQVDEADIQRSETERQIRLKELELLEQREKHARKLRRFFTVIWLIATAIVLGIVIGKMSGPRPNFQDGIKILGYLGIPIIGGGAFLIIKSLPKNK